MATNKALRVFRKALFFSGFDKEIPVESGNTVDYEYNPSGIRVNADISGRTATDFLTDPYNHTGYVQVFKEIGDSNTIFVLGHDVIAQATGTSDPNYFVYDGHGSVRHLANTSGTITESYDYDAYGNAHGFDASSASTHLLYTGEWHDSIAQQYYLRARWYNPANGRFNRMDTYPGSPQDPQSLHKYNYTYSNPINAIDPTGQFSIGEINVTMAIQSGLSALRNYVTIKAIKYATIILVGGVVAYDWYQGIQAGEQVDAFSVGFGGSWKIPKSPFGLATALELAIGRHTGNLALFGAFGATTNNNWSRGGYVGLAFGTPTSDDYRGISRAVTLSFGLLPSKIRNTIENKLQTFLPKLHQAFMRRSGDLGNLANSIDPQIVAKASNAITSCLSKTFGKDASITLWGGGGRAFGFTINPNIPLVSGGNSDLVSATVAGYLQVLPWNKTVAF